MKPFFSPKWVEPEPVTIPEELRRAVLGSELLLETLVRRGFAEPDKARAFLDPSLYSPASPFEFPDMQKAVTRLQKALQNHEKIGIWGDFDVDGQTSTTLLVAAFRNLGAEVIYHIPVRKHESHGILIPPLTEFLDQGVNLIITCDTGISAAEAVAYAGDRGVDVIITDHHSLPADLPRAFALINPQFLAERHPLRTLSGVGVAYELVKALFTSLNEPEFPESLLDLVALGMIADLAELTGDARYLVQKGLRLMQNSPRPSIERFYSENQISSTQVNEETIGYIIAPRMNAVGRLSDANIMVEFLLSKDPVLIATTYNRIEGLNSERKILCDQVFQGAQNQLETTPRLLEKPVLVLGNPEWEAGVVGIVASRLVEQYHRPVILLNTKDPDSVHGSCRSMEGINITAAIRQNQELLTSFGGHPMAAGLSLKAENLEAFQRGINDSVSQMIAGSDLEQVVAIDSFVDLKTVNLDLLIDLSRLAPFGPGNPPLSFAAKDLSADSISIMGKSKDHLIANIIAPDGEKYRFIWWQGAGLPQPDGHFDLLFHARANTYKGNVEVQLEFGEFREIENEIIATRRSKGKTKFTNIDLRLGSNPENELIKLANSSKVEIFSEGIKACPLTAHSRLNLSPSDSLALWTIPPSRLQLQEIIDAVKPKQIYWFGNIPQENELKPLLAYAVGILRGFYTKEGQITINLNNLAAALSVTSTLTALILRWYAASGGDLKILTLNQDEAQLQITKISPDPESARQLQAAIISLHQEMQAFRSFYLRVNSPESLISPSK